MSIFEVGGCIRSKILGTKPKDIDYAVEVSSYKEMRDVVSKGYDIVYEKPEFYTLKAKIRGTKECLDFTMCRKDGTYSDGRRPDDVIPGTILEDLARRDFTMNAIAKIDDKYVDPYNGISDIKNKIIRCVGSIDRITEDSLRMLRAIRFHITLGFNIHEDILEYLKDNKNIVLLDNISKERIIIEINKCFNHDTLKTLRFLTQYPLLEEYLFNIIKLKATM